MTTSGQVINGAGSPGQQVWIGSRCKIDVGAGQHDLLAGRRSEGADRRAHRHHVSRERQKLQRVLQPRRGFRLAQKGEQLADFAQLGGVARSSPPKVTPMATRFTVPKRLTRTGIGEIDPSAITGFSKSTAGPFSASRRVWISVISRTVETGS